MNHIDHQERLRNMILQVAPQDMIEASASALESLGMQDQEHDTATKGLKSLARNEAIDNDQQNVLEAIVLPKYRPVVDIINGTFANPTSPWEHLATDLVKQHIENVVRSIGRVELPGHPTVPFAGTGFVVGPGLLMTNRHVAEIFTHGLGERQIAFKTGRSAAVDFKREIVPSEPQLLMVEQIVMIHPYWDMALLRISGLSSTHPMLPLAISHPDDLAEHEVAVIGYPAQDWRNDIDLQNRIFRGVFNVKRLQPGKLKKRRRIESFGHEVNAIIHDASTLGGNSGSAVVDLHSGEVVALHFAGLYLDANFGVPTYDLARDNRVVQAGVNFTGSVEPTEDWAAIWSLADGVSEAANTNNLISQPAEQSVVQSSTTHTWTIPLRVSVTLGAADANHTVQTGISSVQTGIALDEGLFGGSDDVTELIDQAYQQFALDELIQDDFFWPGVLATAACSHLAYELPSMVTSTVRSAWRFDRSEVVETDNIECFFAAKGDTAVVAFRGTSSVSDLITDLKTFSTMTSYGAVHRGFYFAFQSIKYSLEQIISADSELQRIVLTGHSLGGALATIAAAEWQGKYPITAVYTYGQPGVGKSNFRNFMDQHYRDTFYRFVNDDDIVPKVPPGYTHVGRLFHFNANGGLLQSTSESLHASYDTPTMSESEFAELQATLHLIASRPTTDCIGQEGFLPSFSDHRMHHYLNKILKQSAN